MPRNLPWVADGAARRAIHDGFLLPLEGCDAILGTQWLRELGPIWWDFAKLLMNFHWRGRSISLKGVEAPIHRVVDSPEMC